MMQNKGILMVISGFSGAGKGTLVKKLLSEYDNYALSISMTTRGPREGEQDGREYFFRTKEQFEENIAKTKEVGSYAHHYDATVEAELGKLVGVEDDLVVADKDAAYTNPDDAVKFVIATNIDSLAVAIGTAHGLYKGEP